ncbi:MAG TPA: class I SAM-dependent methyltransferase [Polyangiaceae bacterium]|nr:class I SAM-dependent methyltransferase [Polyangiaceae bacterium]
MMVSRAEQYQEKASAYFGAARSEVLPLLASTSDRVLEIGCGAGRTLELLKRSGRCRTSYGVELVPAVAEEARSRVDHVFVGSIEDLALPLDPGSMNAILCLDVLEHMVDPWSAVAKLTALLAPGGVLVASIPNVQNYRVILPLLLGRWEYTAEGLLDRTHLRFFTRASAIELLECSGLIVERVNVTGIFGRTLRALNLLPVLRPFLGFQYLLCARKPQLAVSRR